MVKVVLSMALLLVMTHASVQDFYVVNDALYQSNDLDKVESNSIQELALNSESLEANYFMAIVTIQKSSFDNPANVFNANKYADKFQQLYRQHAKEQKLMYGEQIMLSDIRFVRLFHYIGLKYLAESNFDKSVEWLNLAEIGYENNFDFNMHISQSYYGIKNYSKSIKYLKIAHSIQPDNSDVVYNIGCMYSLLGGATESIKWLEKAMLLNTKYKEIAINDSDLENIRNTEEFKKLMSR